MKTGLWILTIRNVGEITIDASIVLKISHVFDPIGLASLFLLYSIIALHSLRLPAITRIDVFG